jgi:hypothetical protein
MEPEGSLPHSQELSTCSYPEPDQSSPHHSNLSHYYSPTSVLVFLAVSFLMDFLPITYTRSSSPPFVLHATDHLILLDLNILIILGEEAQITKLVIMQFSPPPPSPHLSSVSATAPKKNYSHWMTNQTDRKM